MKSETKVCMMLVFNDIFGLSLDTGCTRRKWINGTTLYGAVGYCGELWNFLLDKRTVVLVTFWNRIIFIIWSPTVTFYFTELYDITSSWMFRVLRHYNIEFLRNCLSLKVRIYMEVTCNKDNVLRESGD